jgi:hypothetical protein
VADEKVMCVGCGKKNTNPLADRCSICGTILPNANRRRAAMLGVTTAGPSFNVLVESEVGVWQQYAESEGSTPRSRRADGDETTTHKVAAATGQTAMLLAALAVAAAIVFGGWLAFVRDSGSTKSSTTFNTADTVIAPNALTLPDSAWQDVSSPEGRFAVQLPGAPNTVAVDGGTSLIVSETQFVADVTYFDAPQFVGADADRVATETATRLNWQIVRGGVVPGASPTYEGSYNDLKSGQAGFLHLVLVDQRVYMITTRSQAVPVDLVQKRMVDTFRLIG